MSNIEWTDETWNTVIGCSMATAGCTNCYAMKMAKRLEAMGVSSYNGLTRETGGKTVWTGEVRFVESALEKPLRWRKPRKIFVNSMGDLFHPDVPFDWVDRVWDVMDQCPQHEFQILTKHPHRMLKFVDDVRKRAAHNNIILGTSIEDNRVIDRAAHLKKIRGYKKFISFEPLIGSVEGVDLTGIDWAIVGGESGTNARRMKPEWVQEIHDACQVHDTAFFFKQWGRWGEDGISRSKKKNGRLWQGREWNGTPTRVEA